MATRGPGWLVRFRSVITEDAIERSRRLARYVPRVAAGLIDHSVGGRAHVVAGSLVFVDISGFTALSERLARRGRIGAEELTDVLDRVFGEMLVLAYARGGSLLKFGGDALLMLFDGGDHALHAAAAAVEMRAALRKATAIATSVGKISLRMSVGVHTGDIDLFLVGDSHRELVIAGPVATVTTEVEKVAQPGEIVVSDAVAAVLPRDAVGEVRGPGRRLRWRKAPLGAAGPFVRVDLDAEALELSVPRALRSHLLGRSIESEHRMAAVAFVKFSGIDDLIEAEGRAAAGAALHTLVRGIQAAVDDEGVTFLASDIDANGGKVIVVSGVPSAQEDGEGRLLRVARRIVELDQPLAVRIGINRGHVFAGEIGTDFRSTFTVMGDTVNLAARLMAAASPGQVFATHGVLDTSRTLFGSEKLEPFHVKGKKAPVQAYSVGAEIGQRDVRRRREMPFIGRTDELDRLKGLIPDPGTSPGAVVLVRGDSGVGKSRLVDEALAGCPGTFGRLTVTAEPNGVDNTYWALRDPLRRLLGIPRRSQAEMRNDLERTLLRIGGDELARLAPLIGDAAHIDVPDNQATREIDPRFRVQRVAAALSTLLETLHPDGMAVVVEDAHWLDDATSMVIGILADAAASRPWFVAVTTREEGLDLPDATIELGPLSDAESQELVVEMTAGAPLRPDEVRVVVRRAGGSPLFLGEILEVVRETGSVSNLPESLDAVVAAQIDALPELAARLLKYSSVLGRSFRKKVLDAFLEPEDMQLDAATRRALAKFVVEEDEERWRFRHAVIRDVAYQGLSFKRRRELHARAAEVIGRLAGTDLEAVAEFLAMHHSLSGNHREAWKFSLLAGERAREDFVNLEAAGHYERAIESARRLDDIEAGELAGVWMALGDVREAAGLYEGALSAFRAARRIADDPLLVADLHLRQARVRARVGAYQPAFRDITLGRKIASSRPGPGAHKIMAQATSLRAQLRQLQEHPRAAIALARVAVAEAEAAGEEAALARSCQVLDASYNMIGQPSKAVFGGRALEIYERRNDLAGVATITNNLGGRAYFEGQWDRALEYYERAESAHRRSGNEAAAATTSANRAEVLVSQLRFDEAEPLLTAAIRALRAHHLIDAALFAELQMGRLLLLRGDHEQARGLLEAIRSEATELGQTHSALEAAIHLADLAVITDDPGTALADLDAAESRAGDEAELYATMLARVRAVALDAVGRSEEALRLVRAGLEQARDEGLSYEEALLLGVEARLLSMTEPELSTKRSEEALRLLRSLGVVEAPGA